MTKLDFKNMIQELRELKYGWYEGYGESIPSEALDFLEDFYEGVNEKYLPHLYPMANNGISIEWTIRNFEISYEATFYDNMIHVHILNMNNDKVYESDFKIPDFINLWTKLVSEPLKLN